MIREAINKALKNVSALGGRVYEAYTAPADTAAPYATVKFATQRPSTAITFAGDNNIEVRIYGKPTSFKSLDAIEQEVINVLNDKEVEDSDGNKYYVWWVPGGADYTEDDRGLIVRLVNFAAGAMNGRG
jgi:hypothetical protein